MRIDKFICDTINITRTQAKNKISKGSVFKNGKRVRSGSEQVDFSDEIILDGNKISYRKYVYIMMNKPAGVLSASRDLHSITALDLLSKEDKRHDLFVAGRLDKDTTGFLLITNDGSFAHDILSPKKHIFKTYVVTLKNSVRNNYTRMFADGIVLEDGYVCKPAKFKKLDNFKCQLEISEGKFHQIKRMFKSLDNEVVSLKRVALGSLLLDDRLNEGSYRYLNDQEIDEILGIISKKTPQTIYRASK